MFVLLLVIIIRAAMYVIEGAEDGSDFTSIPISIYWAIVTITTVGYGDITPNTMLGQLLSVTVMLLGYAVIAVPTGIVTMDLVRKKDHDYTTTSCPSCSKEGHDMDAAFCKFCSAKLD